MIMNELFESGICKNCFKNIPTTLNFCSYTCFLKFKDNEYKERFLDGNLEDSFNYKKYFSKEFMKKFPISAKFIKKMGWDYEK